MNMKKEWKWLVAFALISLGVIGFMTQFRFKDLEIQRYDTYYVINAFRAIFYMTLILWTSKNLYLLVDLMTTSKNLYLLVDLMTTRYTVVAIVVSVINPLVGLFMCMLIYFNMAALITFKQTYPNISLIGYIIPLTIVVGIVFLQAIIEIRALKKVRALMRE
jgi:hypothetical protein